MQSLRELVDNPERRAQAQALQAELRQRYGPSLNRHPAELQFIYGVDRVETVLPQLEALEQKADQDSPDHQRHVDFLHNSLAEGLSYQGRYREAAAITHSPPHAREYMKKADALEAIGHQCECPETLTFPSPYDAKGVAVPARLRVEAVYNGTYHLTLTRCLLCGGYMATRE